MQPDKSKKYEFCGEVYSWVVGMWRNKDLSRNYSHTDFQLFADHGHSKEVREPLVFEGVVTFADECTTWFEGITVPRNLPRETRLGKTFKVTWTEVVK